MEINKIQLIGQIKMLSVTLLLISRRFSKTIMWQIQSQKIMKSNQNKKIKIYILVNSCYLSKVPKTNQTQ